MQIPDEVRNCVAFMAHRNEADYKLGGTAFFVGLSIPGTDRLFVYAVTARHVIEEINKRSIDGKAYLRMNFPDQDARYVPSELTEWHYHPDERVDVAVIPVGMFDQSSHRCFLVSSFATSEVISKESVGIGDEVFLAGLFVEHCGRKNNIPIVRVGNIAAMPEEKVQTKIGEMDAFLVEARSIGGISGSPVFVHLGTTRSGAGALSVRPAQFFLLGLMHGHWELGTKRDSVVHDGLFQKSVNMGIAIVVPAAKILDVINLPTFVAQREQGEEMIRKRASLGPRDSS